jgi:CubicO group peptidase (beta-lactamase class C family)
VRRNGINHGRRPLAWAVVASGVLMAAPLASQAPAGSDPGDDGWFAGRWEGAFGSGSELAPLALTLARSGAGWTGTFDLPAEGVHGIPFSEAVVRADSVILTLRGGDGGVVLRGRLARDSISGILHVPSGERPVLLGRPDSPVAARMAAAVREARETARDRPLEPLGPAPARGRVDALALDHLLQAAEAANSDAVVILHDGEVVGAWYARGERRPIEAMSATKSIVNLAVGRLLTQGRLPSVDAPVHTFFPEWNDGLKAEVTVRHLLNHTSGLHADRTTEAIYASPDFVRHALDSEVTAPPGTAIFYNNSATNLLAGVIGVAAGQPMDEYLRDDLFAILGIQDFSWTRDSAGNPHGMAGLQILPADLARLGQLVLDRGRVGSEQVIAESWFDQSLRPGSELSGRVGLLWWLIREPGTDGEPGAGPIVGYRADGYLGQYLVIYPAQRLVGVRMVASSPAYDPGTDGFQEFQELLRALVP